jgi:hypothetical protein
MGGMICGTRLARKLHDQIKKQPIIRPTALAYGRFAAGESSSANGQS